MSTPAPPITILKFRLEVEFEVADRATFEAYVRALPEYQPLPREDRMDDDDSVLPEISDLREDVMELGHSIGGAPGLRIHSISSQHVEWFANDHIVDPRHPDYKPLRKRRKKKAPAGESGEMPC